MIVERYSFNVPKNKTQPYKKYELAAKGGKCDKPCEQCEAKKQGACNGCAGMTCMDRACPGTECSRCAVFCGRAKERINESFTAIKDYRIDKKKSFDVPIQLPEYIPSISRRIAKKIESEAYLIPFYAFFSFEKEQVIVNDVRKSFGISNDAKVICSFGMKDDRISLLFEYMLKNKFIDILNEIKGVDYWCTPCFSVFDISNCHDQTINFKRQFWVGDMMRENGFKVFQEALYTDEHKIFNHATMENALSIIEQKEIKNVCINFQLFGNREITEDSIIEFLMRLKPDVTVLCYGVSEKISQSILQYRRVCASSFTFQFERRGHGY
jgi:hypothetical protein